MPPFQIRDFITEMVITEENLTGHNLLLLLLLNSKGKDDDDEEYKKIVINKDY